MSLRQQWKSSVKKEESRKKRLTPATRFRARHPFYGPVIWGASIFYFITQVLVARAWRPPYSWLRNSISDLGNTSCHPQCSPHYAWMNFAFFGLGLVMAVGSWFIFEEFTEKKAAERLAARIGFLCLALGGVGAVVVAAFPEDSVGVVHVVGAFLGIGVGTFGVFVLGWGIAGSLDKPLIWGMRVVPPVAMVVGVMFAFHVHLGLGDGAMERISAYPETIWLIIFGIYIAQSHYRKAHPKPAASTIGRASVDVK